MRLKVNKNGLVIPPSFLTGLDEVEVSREGDFISIKKVDKIPDKHNIDISIIKGEKLFGTIDYEENYNYQQQRQKK